LTTVPECVCEEKAGAGAGVGGAGVGRAAVGEGVFQQPEETNQTTQIPLL